MNKTFIIPLYLLLLSASAVAQDHEETAKGAVPFCLPDSEGTGRERKSPIPEGCKPEVPHFIHTTWDQGEPYYNQTPTDSAGTHCRTGCVATSLAQIMNYYRYPKRMADGTRLRWKHMRKGYHGDYKRREGEAVALLMARCGKAVKMNYGVGVSLTYPKETADGVVREFGYIVKDYGYRDYPNNPNYDEAKWKEIIYRELSAGRPVLYGGTSYKHGQDRYYSHSFILDGYDREGRVHANYGFGGKGDGYFDLDKLPMKYDDVDEEFDTYQTLVVIHRPEDGPIDYDLEPLP